jgi:acetyl-CoA carboxylase carboxyl transferase subunit beta
MKQPSEIVKEATSSSETKQLRPVPMDLAVKCPGCKEIILARDYRRNLKVCPFCHYHFRLTAYERLELLIDPGSFSEMDANLSSVDPLHFVSQSQVYAEKLLQERQRSGINDAVIIGHATVEGQSVALGVMDFRFIGGSMGTVVGEKITRVIEFAIEQAMPVLIVSASGGARMQEGLYSLMQMVKTSGALAKLGEAGLPYISLLTDPTAGGVTASFALSGDIILAEPGAMVCFAGPRVIEQLIHEKLPEGAVSAESLLQHGMIDVIVPRHQLRQTLTQLLHFYQQIPPYQQMLQRWNNEPESARKSGAA